MYRIYSITSQLQQIQPPNHPALNSWIQDSVNQFQYMYTHCNKPHAVQRNSEITVIQPSRRQCWSRWKNISTKRMWQKSMRKPFHTAFCSYSEPLATRSSAFRKSRYQTADSWEKQENTKDIILHRHGQCCYGSRILVQFSLLVSFWKKLLITFFVSVFAIRTMLDMATTSGQ